MKRAVSFASTIKNSEKISTHFKEVVETYKAQTNSNLVLDCIRIAIQSQEAQNDKHSSFQ